MAGGTWLSQNKVRPGAYINFKAVPTPTMTVGDRGIVAIGLPLSWGDEENLIEVLSSELLDGGSQKLIGFTAFDEESKLLAGALSYAYKALVFRTNSGGNRAKATVGNLEVEAKYQGEYGNEIMFSIETNEVTKIASVITYVKGEVVDTQEVMEADELEDNDYVRFNVKEKNVPFIDTAATQLSGGTNGTEEDETETYPKLLAALKKANWQTFACMSTNVSVQKNVCDFIKQMRDDEGRYVQAVVADYDGANYEGLINVANGVCVDGVEFRTDEAVAIVAGMTAGANFNESNTAREVNGGRYVIGEFTDAEIKKNLKNGKFLFSTSVNGKVKVEQDINSLHTFTKTKNYSFSKNRVIRTLDEIGTTTVITWEGTYMGKVDNNETGRGLFKSDLIAYGNELQRLAGIQEFAGADDIAISQGNDLDVVLVEWAVKPVDSMEKLYMTVNVRG